MTMKDAFPSGWAKTTLGDIVGVIRGRNAPQDCPGLPFIGMENVEAHTMRLLGTVPASTMRSAAVHFFPGDVLYGRLRPYLNKVVKPDFEGLCSAEFIPLTPISGVSDRLLQFRINAADFVSFASHLDEGDRPRIDFGQIEVFPVNLPPTAEQHRIVAAIEDYISRLDEAVVLMERVQRNLKRYRASVLKAAVEGRLVPTEADLARAEGRTYEPASVLLERILEERRRRWKADGGKGTYKEPAAPDTTNLPELPEGWCWATCEQISHFITKGTTPSALKMSQSHGKIPFIKVYNLTFSGRLAFDIEPTFISDGVHRAELARSIVRPGDVLMNIVGPPLGKVSIVPICWPEWNINQAIVRYRPEPEIAVNFFAASLRADSTIRRAKCQAKTTVGQVNLTLEICRALPIAIAPVSEQLRIVSELERIESCTDQLAATTETQILRSNRLRQSILKWAFEGRLADQDPTDEPASALLERIRCAQAVKEGTYRSKRTRRLATNAEVR